MAVKQSNAVETCKLLIDGTWHESEATEYGDVFNPSTGEVIAKVPMGGDSDVDKAVQSAHKAFLEWREVPAVERARLMFRFKNLLDSNFEEIARLVTREHGKTLPEARASVQRAIEVVEFSCGIPSLLTGESIENIARNVDCETVRHPLGVCAGIAPFNFPAMVPLWMYPVAITCGNTFVLKPSEKVPLTSLFIAELLVQAGAPKGVLNVVSNAPDDAPEIVETLIGHPAIRRINFTGSTRVGRIIAEAAGRHLKPVLLELGGKAPMVVLDDADLDQAVAAAAFGAYMNQGQICMSTERIVVLDAVADAFVAKMAEKAGELVAGDPRQGNCPLGSLVDRRAAERVVSLVQDAVGKGAVLCAGGDAEGTIMPATLLDRVTPAMRIYAEESFGPVVSVIRAGSIDEAVRIANDTEYGLSASVFGRDVNRALSVARRIESGICHINGPTVHDEAQMPFGGVKESGYGRFGGKAVIDEFTELRWITIQDGPLHYPI